MKLEFKQIACYFPYELKIMQYRDDLKLSFESILISLSNDTLVVTSPRFPFNERIQYHEAKLILRPLSDLNKEIEVNGQKFIPINWVENQYPNLDLHNQCKFLLDDESWINQCEYLLIQHLFEWHFDISNLIKNNLAIDINTINQ